jgi:hypothetical protein
MNLADETGAVPLHIAADTLDLASVSALLALGAGASKQLKTHKGDTPLALAKQAVTRQNAFFRRLGMPGPVNAGDIAAQQQIPQQLK